MGDPIERMGEALLKQNELRPPLFGKRAPPREIGLTADMPILESDDNRLIQVVFASVAKQSTVVPMDCFATLAKTIQSDVIML